jgi:uncharacterized repeat protein (TIGR03803 family)
MRSYYLLLCCALLGGCSSGAAGTVPPSATASGGWAMDSAYAPYVRSPRRDSVAYQSLYSFQGGSGDGANPQAGLLDVEGTLYGTTESGGPNGYGTVFAIAPSGTETVLHYFGASSEDGTFPQAGLINVKGTLYGTTFQGGAHDLGTVFAITPSGTETVLYSFMGKCNGSCTDAAYPLAGLLDVNGTLYGTTQEGGAGNYGTVFTITPSGTETVLYGFNGGKARDGQFPQAGLINVKGTLYGTTYEGGPKEYGTVFAVTPSGTEKVIHRFAPSSGDGANPAAVLIDVKGKLYGTTFDGGAYNYGTVFAITPSGKETVLHSFGSYSGDGEEPEYAGLIHVQGALYGTTARGGGTNAGGTVFKITPSGKEAVRYNFPHGSGSAYQPEAGLIDVNGKLYGTTYYGGAYGDGTVFAMKP